MVLAKSSILMRPSGSPDIGGHWIVRRIEGVETCSARSREVLLQGKSEDFVIHKVTASRNARVDSKVHRGLPIMTGTDLLGLGQRRPRD